MAVNLIGISGKLGSGKDLVGTILQILNQSPHFTNKAVAEFTNREILQPEYEIKKFADELKDTICRWIGCTREQLENREFKEKELGEEWWYYLVSVNKGNDTVSRMINYIDAKISNEDSFDDMNTIYEDEINNLIKPTPRMFLQLLGTETGREIIHPNIWVNALFADYIDINPYPTKEVIYPKWIITDVRFPNEAEAIKARGGKLIRIERPTNLDLLPFPELIGEMQEQAGLKNTVNQHPSETALDNYDGFDETIINDGSIEDLVEKIRKLHYV